MTDRDVPRPGVPPRPGTAPPPGAMHPRHHQQHTPPPAPPYGGAPGPAPGYGPPPGYGVPPPGYGAPPPGYGPPPGGPYGPPPGYGVPPPGYGAPPPGVGGPYGPPGAPVRHRPGPGAVVGLVGWALLAACFLVLPFLEAPQGLGDDATFMDMRDAVTAEVPAPATTTLDPSPMPPEPSPAPGAPGPQGLQGLQGQVPVTPAAGTDPRDEWIESYIDVLWAVVLGMVGLGVLFATLWVPRSQGGRAICGFLGAGLVGLVANMADARGTYGPKVTGATAVVVAGLLHGYALSEIFGRDLAPDPGLGVYAGGLGIVLALAGVLMGTRTEPARYGAGR